MPGQLLKLNLIALGTGTSLHFKADFLLDLPPLQKILCKRLSLGLVHLPMQIAANTKEQQDQQRPQFYAKNRKQNKTSR